MKKWQLPNHLGWKNDNSQIIWEKSEYVIAENMTTPNNFVWLLPNFCMTSPKQFGSCHKKLGRFSPKLGDVLQDIQTSPKVYMTSPTELGQLPIFGRTTPKQKPATTKFCRKTYHLATYHLYVCVHVSFVCSRVLGRGGGGDGRVRGRPCCPCAWPLEHVCDGS